MYSLTDRFQPPFLEVVSSVSLSSGRVLWSVLKCAPCVSTQAHFSVEEIFLSLFVTFYVESSRLKKDLVKKGMLWSLAATGQWVPESARAHQRPNPGASEEKPPKAEKQRGAPSFLRFSLQIPSLSSMKNPPPSNFLYWKRQEMIRLLNISKVFFTQKRFWLLFCKHWEVSGKDFLKNKHLFSRHCSLLPFS